MALMQYEHAQEFEGDDGESLTPSIPLLNELQEYLKKPVILLRGLTAITKFNRHALKPCEVGGSQAPHMQRRHLGRRQLQPRA